MLKVDKLTARNIEARSPLLCASVECARGRLGGTLAAHVYRVALLQADDTPTHRVQHAQVVDSGRRCTAKSALREKILIKRYRTFRSSCLPTGQLPPTSSDRTSAEEEKHFRIADNERTGTCDRCGNLIMGTRFSAATVDERARTIRHDDDILLINFAFLAPE